MSALRRSDIVVMFPALRGFSGNRGKPECFLGEVDDILAAAEHLAKRPDVVTPTLVIEGEHSGNADQFPVLQKQASRVVKFVMIAGADHFNVLAPATEALARAILADIGPKVSITLDTAAIARGVEKSD